MKKLTKALLPAIALLMASIVSLVGVTFAWFENGKTAEVESFSANVQAADGILVSWDATNPGSLIEVGSAEYLSIASNTVMDDSFEYRPVSSVGDVTAGVMSLFETAPTNNMISSISAATSGFVKFDLYFHVYEDNTTIWLSSDSTVSADGTIGLASRIAFINQGCDSTSTASTAKALMNGVTSSTMIWEPNSTVHTTQGSGDYEYDQNSVYTYFGLKSAEAISTAFNREASPLEADADKTGNSKYDVNAVNHLGAVNNLKQTATDIQLNLSKGINKVTVYIWVEGQDHDCTNLLQSTALTVYFKFTKENPVQG